MPPASPSSPGAPATTPTTGPTLTGPTEAGSLAWASCTGGDVAPGAPGPMQCARIEVPANHDDPGGDTVSLGVLRVPATDPAQRLGSLFVNPGGPGASGVELAQSLASLLGPQLRARYDLVGFDPRGVGASQALDCGLADQLFPAAPGGGALDAQQQYGQSMVTACELEAPGVLRGLGTVAVARDLDLLREAVGDAQLSYLGFSYGSTLGAVYAQLYPQRVGRMVLDGALAPNQAHLDWVSDQMRSFESVLQRFFRACDAEPSCPLTQAPSGTVWRTLAERAAEEGLPTSTAARLDRRGFIDATFRLLRQGTDRYEHFAQLLAEAAAGDATGLARLGAASTGISAAAYYGVVCGDEPTRVDLDAVRTRMEQLADEAPDFAAEIREVLTCNAVPPSGEGIPLIDIEPGEVAPILVITSTHDPAAPTEGAVAMAEALGGAALLTYRNDGHTIAFRGNRCVDAVVTRYLLDALLPAPATGCRPVSDIGVVLLGNDAGPGAIVSSLSPGSVAVDRLVVGDTVLAVNGMALTSPLQLEEAAQYGDAMVVRILRSGRERQVTLVPTAPPYWAP